MHWVAWDATLSKPDDKGVPARAHLQFAADRGSARALQEITPPCEFPEELAYLRGWFMELHRTRGHDMGGALPLAYPMIESWARLSGRSPAPHEVEALFSLDGAYRFPESIKSMDEATSGSNRASQRRG